MNIYTVTISGADDSVRPQQLVELSNKYPFVEWAILLSPTQEGQTRFPSAKWLDTLREHSDRLRLAGHLCGRWVRDVVERGELSYKVEREQYWTMFHRIQLNFHGDTSKACPHFLDAIHLMRNKEVIFQIESFENNLYQKAKEANLNVSPLFDLSYGTGNTPRTWPKSLAGIRCGFAGGLGPDNLEAEIQKMQEACPYESEIWIDMETKVRSDNDLLFDLFKVERVLDIAEDYVTPDSFASTYLETDDGKKTISDSLIPPPGK